MLWVQWKQGNEKCELANFFLILQFFGPTTFLSLSTSLSTSSSSSLLSSSSSVTLNYVCDEAVPPEIPEKQHGGAERVHRDVGTQIAFLPMFRTFKSQVKVSVTVWKKTFAQDEVGPQVSGEGQRRLADPHPRGGGNRVIWASLSAAARSWWPYRNSSYLFNLTRAWFYIALGSLSSPSFI